MRALGIIALCIIGSLSVSFPGHAKPRKSDAARFTDQAIKLKKEGDYAAAARMAERALTASEKSFGPTHQNTLQTLINLAGFYKDQGRLADAERIEKRAISVTEQKYGATSVQVATELIRLNNIYTSSARYAEAEPLLNRVLAIREKHFGPDHPEVARALGFLSYIVWMQGRYSAAEEADRRALAIFEKKFGPVHADVAKKVLSLATVYRDQQRYQEAEPLFKRVLEIREKLFGADSSTFAEALKALGDLYLREQRYDEAETVLIRALTIDERTVGVSHRFVAADCTSLGELYSDQHRFTEAEAYYKRALAIFQSGLRQVQPDFVAAAQNNLANVYYQTRRLNEAEPLYNAALAIEEKLLGSRNHRIAKTLNNLAAVYRDQARYSEAEALYMRAFQIAERTFGPDFPGLSGHLDHLAALYARQKRYGEALPFAQRDIATGHASAPVVLDVLYGAARDGYLAREVALDESLAIVEQSTQNTAAAAIKKLGMRLAAGSGRLADLIRQEQDLTAEAGRLEKAILSAVTREQSQRDPAVEQNLRQRLVIIARDKSTIQQTIGREFPKHVEFSRPTPLKTRDVQSLLTGDEALVIFAPGRDDTTFVFALTSDSFDWKVIPISPGSLSQRVSIFRSGLDIDIRELNRGLARVDELLNPISEESKAFNLGYAHDLYKTLLAPVDHLIQPKKDLLIVPFGALTALPFHLLVSEPSTNSDEHIDFETYRHAAWLIKRHTVSILPSIASLRALRVAKSQTHPVKPMVGFGDPVFNPNEQLITSAGGSTASPLMTAQKRSFSDYWKGIGVDRSLLSQALARLPETAFEVEQIADKLGASRDDIHLRQSASETTLKSLRLSSYRIIYFATHGLVAGDIKGLAEPSLVLTIPARPSDVDDGLLTASEIAQLSLNADWIVLSACNTIAGDKPGAEALSGLARAFFYAGAKALLVSHWAVESRAAARLATSTFEHLQSDPTIGRAEALRRAMLSYLADTSDPKNAYPAFWGPFAIIGEPRGH
jgi:CHAT domain-containing protein/tetratricopeptide (TPR) repeat protein